MLKTLFYSLLLFISSSMFASAQSAHEEHVQVQTEECRIGDFGCRHNEYHNWYQTGENGGPIMRPDVGGSCCNVDCRPTKVRFELDEKGNDKVYAFIDGAWILVPPGKIKKVKKVDSLAHVCASRATYYSGMTIYCVILPELEN